MRQAERAGDDRGRWYRAAGLSLALALGLGGCSAAAPPAAQEPARSAPIVRGPAPFYEFTALDGSKISSDASLGRNTVIAFLTSYGGSSQAQARFLNGVAHDHAPRTNCYAIFTERPENRPLIEMFVEVLKLRLPVAQVDYAELKGGPFANVLAVPTVIILDRGGHIAWRKDALATQDEIEKVLRTLE